MPTLFISSIIPSPFFPQSGVCSYFYSEVAYRVFFLVWFISDTLVWIVGREAYHIGASGVIYSLATFLFTSGILRRNRNLMAISLLVIFLYGSMVWGLFPYDYHISWESHLMGALTGVALSYCTAMKAPNLISTNGQRKDGGRMSPAADEVSIPVTFRMISGDFSTNQYGGENVIFTRL